MASKKPQLTAIRISKFAKCRCQARLPKQPRIPPQKNPNKLISKNMIFLPFISTMIFVNKHMIPTTTNIHPKIVY